MKNANIFLVLILSCYFGTDALSNDSMERYQKYRADRTQALMTVLKVVQGNKSLIQLPYKRKLQQYQFDHETRHEIEMDGEFVKKEILFFLNAKARTEAFIKATYYKSEHDARYELMGSLTESPLPTEILVTAYRRIENGPGEYCISIDSDRPEGVSLAESTKSVFFLRNNISVEVQTFESGLSAIELSRQVDKILMEEIK